MGESLLHIRQDNNLLDSHSDWTDFFDRSAIIRRANDVIDHLVREIHSRRLAVHGDLSVQELALLYRFPIHVGVNIFIERLLRVAHSKEMGWSRTYPEVFYQPRYFKDTNEAVTTHYVDFAINNHLLHRIYRILGGPPRPDQESGLGIEQPRPQDALLYKPLGILDRTKKTLKTLIEFYVKLSKPEVVGEYSNWMQEILPFSQMLSFNYPVCDCPTDNETRAAIKDGCRIVFLNHVDGILNTLEVDQKEKLSVLFAEFIDHIIPKALVEGLTERFSYHERLTRRWNVKQIHSFIGYYYSENFKIFAILARRKGARLIGHAHGASNPMSSYKQSRNELTFLDFYFTWGKNDSTWLKGDLKHDRLKMINIGSTYLSTIKKWHKKKIVAENMTILYPSGPFVDFMGDLQEIIPERNYQHRLSVLYFLKEIWNTYPKLKVYYKPFPGTYTNDPIKSLFSDEFKNGSLELIQMKPSALYQTVDVVLWDTISTGFCESVSAGVPTLVFQSRYEYEQAVSLGKNLDEDLMACEMLFYDIESGIKSFNRIINELEMFLQCRKEAIGKFQEATAYPITKERFRTMFREALPQNS